MDNAKKLLLVDPSKASQLYRPTISDKKLSKLDQDITETLNNDLPDDEKAKRYMLALKTYRRYTAPIVTKGDVDDSIIQTVQPELRIKAKRLLKHIKPHVKLSEDQLVHGNSLIDDSSISELLNEALTKDSAEKPIGWVEFADTLKRAKTPRELIRNEKLWTYMNPKSRKTITKRNWQHI
jgi:hypothetical protein